jgi:uncharacterized protein (DUF3820 family)
MSDNENNKFCSKCGCITETNEIEQTFKNNKIHIRLECNICGYFFKYKQQKVKSYILHFGMYRGKELKKVETYYLNWLLDENFVKENVKDYIRSILQARSSS